MILYMWEKIIVRATSSATIENITAVLISNGIAGMEIVDAAERVRYLETIASKWDYADDSLLVNDGLMYVVYYLARDEGYEEKLCKIGSELRQLDGVEVTHGQMDDNKWQDEWKKHFKPIKIGEIVIVPEWEEYEKKTNETVFRIDPGAAFGTGQHESTMLSVLALTKFVKEEDIVLDIGCGSGILSCISSLIGAKKVVACDIDTVGAISATKRNAILNGISNIEVLSGDALSELSQKLSEKKYDVVVANIVADVIIELAPFVKGILNSGGRFISSGIIGEKVEEVKAKFLSEELEIVWTKESNDWFAFVVKKNA